MIGWEKGPAAFAPGEQSRVGRARRKGQRRKREGKRGGSLWRRSSVTKSSIIGGLGCTYFMTHLLFSFRLSCLGSLVFLFCRAFFVCVFFWRTEACLGEVVQRGGWFAS
ncbi:unnamed protein product, partial [Ectocarpus fasciculatus]